MLAGLHEDETAHRFFVSRDCHPQTIAVLRQRAEPRGIEVVVGDHASFAFDKTVFGALVQYPATDGTVHDYRELLQPGPRRRRAGGDGLRSAGADRC